MARYPFSVSSAIVASALVGGTELLVCTIAPIIPVFDAAAILITWSFALTLGVGVTALATLIRRGTTTAATLVNTNQSEAVTASTLVRRSGQFVDTAAPLAAPQYSLTLTTTGGNGTLQEVCVAAFCL